MAAPLTAAESDGPRTELETLRKWFRDSEDALHASRRQSQRDRDYVDGKQWTADEARRLNQRGQSDAVYNRMRQKVDTIVGVEQEMRTDPQAFPRTPNEEGAAETATDALRYVCDQTDFDSVASLVFDQACVVEGAAGVEIAVEEPPPGMRGTGMRIVCNVYLFDRIGWDPHSRLADFSDGRYRHTITWMDRSQAERKWPDRAEIIGQAFADTTITGNDVYDDTPRFWADRNRSRLQVIQMWWLEGKQWWVATLCYSGYLEDPRLSPYVSDVGESECGLLLCSGYVSREGERYGAARQWVGPQDDINKRRSKLNHLSNSRQTVADYGVVKDKRAFKKEMAKPDGHWDKEAEGELTVLPTGEMANIQLGLLQEAKAEIDETGPSAHNLVAADGLNAASGVARQTDQRASMLPLSLLLENHRKWKLACYCAMWSRVRQFWTGPKWLRVTDNPESTRWVGINMPVTLGEQVAQGFAQRGLQVPPEAMQDPRMQMVVGIQNQPAQMDVDIIIDEGPDVVSTAQQEFDTLLRLSERYPQIPLGAIIRASALRGKDELLEAIEGDPEQAQAMAAKQQQQEQVTNAMLMANIEKLLADAEQKRAQAAQIVAETPSEIEYNEARADQATANAAKAAQEAGRPALPVAQ